MVLIFFNHPDTTDIVKGATPALPSTQLTTTFTPRPGVAEAVAVGGFSDIPTQVFYANSVGGPPPDLAGCLDDNFDAPLLRVMSFIPTWPSTAEWASGDSGTWDSGSGALAYHE